ncbi:unnamed protein product [Absidia cylindrospora]
MNFNVDDDKKQIEHREAWTMADQSLEKKLSTSPHPPPMIPRRSPRRKPSQISASTSNLKPSLDNGTTEHANIGKDNESSSTSSSSSSSSLTSASSFSSSSSSTEIYYADMTLPHLLKIVSQTQKNSSNSKYQV